MWGWGGSEQPEITQYLGSKRSEQPEITGSNWEEKDTNSAWGGMVCEYAQDHLVSPILFVLNSWFLMLNENSDVWWILYAQYCNFDTANL